MRSEAEQAARKAKAAATQAQAPCEKRWPGRPQGSKNTPQADGPFPPECGRLAGWLDAVRHLIAGVIPLTSLVLDGHCGNHHALQMVRQHTLHLMSKRRYDAALSCPSTGPDPGRGPHRQYGDKVDDDTLPLSALKDTTGTGPMKTCLFQV